MGRKKKKKTKNQQITAKISQPDYIAYTDGGCAFNPGGPGGIGVVLINTETGETTEVSRGYLATTNNRMEISAVIEALSHIPEGASVELYSDSQYTLNCMSGAWSKRKNTDLWGNLNRLAKGKKISLNWVRGHNGNPFNERCDELATMGIQSGSKIEDKGYHAEKERGREFYAEVDRHLQRTEAGSGGAMSVKIDIPEELADSPPEITRPKEYAAKYNVHVSCAKAICEFYMMRNGGRFKDYIPLKTGGIDAHSRKKAEIIAETRSCNPDLCLSTVQSYFSSEKEVNSAMRWYSHGLTLKDAIRKVLVDTEISANCMR